MQVTADSAFTAVHVCQMLDVAEGETLSGDIAGYLLRTGAAVSPADDEATQLKADLAKPAAPKTAAVSDNADEAGELDVNGTIDQVLTWVGDDQERAQIALDAEESRDKPRSTLLAQLTDIVEN